MRLASCMQKVSVRARVFLFELCFPIFRREDQGTRAERMRKSFRSSSDGAQNLSKVGTR